MTQHPISFLCQEDAYLLELVRYIHLNPIRSHLVANLDELERFPFSGHSVLVGRLKRSWQETQRILGDGDFVAQVFASAEESMEKRYALRSVGMDLDDVAARVSKLMGLGPEAVWAAGKCRQTVEARSLLCYWAVRELGVSMSSMAKKLGISVPSVSDSVARGQKIATQKKYLL